MIIIIVTILTEIEYYHDHEYDDDDALRNAPITLHSSDREEGEAKKLIET